jgi:hypothetical protein
MKFACRKTGEVERMLGPSFEAHLKSWSKFNKRVSSVRLVERRSYFYNFPLKVGTVEL